MRLRIDQPLATLWVPREMWPNVKADKHKHAHTQAHAYKHTIRAYLRK